MKNKTILAIFVIATALLTFKSYRLYASEEHKNDHKEDHANHDDHGNGKDKHEDEHEGEHQDEHGDEHEENENSKVGPDKGITSASAEEGFSLSPEALKNFDVQTIKIDKASPWNIPASAVVNSLEEVNIYRIRDGHIKRIDFEIVTSDKRFMKINSHDLKNGDSVIINGVGFVRIAELVAYGGGSEGHSH